MTEPPSITCPDCGHTSGYELDIAEEYCGHCHKYIGGEDIAVQIRCPNCAGEQYAPAVTAFSMGETRCHHCGHDSTPMTSAAYQHSLAAARKREH